MEPKAIHACGWGIKHTFTFYQFDTSLHTRIRITNLLERLFREFRTKADEIGAFPNETSCLTGAYRIWGAARFCHEFHELTRRKKEKLVKFV